MVGHPSGERMFTGAPDAAPQSVTATGRQWHQERKPLATTGALGPKEGTAGGSIDLKKGLYRC